MTTVYRGALVFDPDRDELEIRDVAVHEGVFIDAESVDGSADVVDLDGCILAPGFVDLHTHVFEGQDLGAPISSFAAASGTTYVVDAGSSGAHLLGAFRRAVSGVRDVRVAALLNVSSIGATSITLAGELHPAYVDTGAAIDAVQANRDLIRGVKVRASANVGGAFTDEALALARTIADAVDLPLMVHLGPAPAGIDRILSTLRAGDILTHAFTGWPDNSASHDGRARASVHDAVQRGVLLDVGHGATGFSFAVAETLAAEGILPTTISSDVHAYSTRQVVGLHVVMSKFLAIGMTLVDVLRRVTSAPAGALDLFAGCLRPGAPADLAVFRLRSGEFMFEDGFGGQRRGTELIDPLLTVSGGRLAFNARGMHAEENYS